jgi:hypothetical protein
MPGTKIEINRAPVLTLWAAVVAERLGHEPNEALTLGRGVAGLNAQSKGKVLGIFEEKKEKGAGEAPREKGAASLIMVPLLGRLIPALKTPQGLRAVSGDQAIDARSVQVYLEQKFGEHLDEARIAMEQLAKTYTPHQLAVEGFALYEKFRPQIPEGKKGWGAKGVLDLASIRSLKK